MGCHYEPQKMEIEGGETLIANVWGNTDQLICGKYIQPKYKNNNYDKFYDIDDDKNENNLDNDYDDDNGNNNDNDNDNNIL